MAEYYDGKLKCPVCGDKIGQLEQHLRRKQDQQHKNWREQADQGGADQQGEKLEEQEPKNTEKEPYPQETRESKDENMFKSHTDTGGGQKQVQKQKPQQQRAQRQQMGMQKKIELAKQGEEPWEHDCKGMEGKAEFYEKKDQCPRCGANLQWGQLGVW